MWRHMPQYGDACMCLKMGRHTVGVPERSRDQSLFFRFFSVPHNDFKVKVRL